MATTVFYLKDDPSRAFLFILYMIGRERENDLIHYRICLESKNQRRLSIGLYNKTAFA